MPKKAFISGSAGFIGSNLTNALLKKGYHVVGFDNLSYGNLDNLKFALAHPGFTLIEDDVRDTEAVLKASADCDVLVHLAAHKIPRYSDAYDTLIVNARGAENLLAAAAKTGAKLVAASTSDVYGKNPNVPFQEGSDSVIGSPDVARWAYAISKMYEEQLLFAGHKRFGIDVVLLRFFGGYGPNQNLTWWGGPQSVFINCALDNEEIPIHGDGQQTRTFTYVEDHVKGIMMAMEQDSANNTAFNIGGTQEISIEELARLIWSLVRQDESPKIRFIPYETFGKYEDVQRRVPDITRARELLGFEPGVDLDTGLRRTIEWQINRRKELGISTPTITL